jgi:hypothetical protein
VQTEPLEPEPPWLTHTPPVQSRPASHTTRPSVHAWPAPTVGKHADEPLTRAAQRSVEVHRSADAVQSLMQMRPRSSPVQMRPERHTPTSQAWPLSNSGRHAWRPLASVWQDVVLEQIEVSQALRQKEPKLPFPTQYSSVSQSPLTEQVWPPPPPSVGGEVVMMQPEKAKQLTRKRALRSDGVMDLPWMCE